MAAGGCDEAGDVSDVVRHDDVVVAGEADEGGVNRVSVLVDA
jgi:hypothetical protein